MDYVWRMKTVKRYCTIVLACAVLLLLVIYQLDSGFQFEVNTATQRIGLYSKLPSQRHWHHRYEPTRHTRFNEIRLAVVACNDRLEETLTMLKSAILFAISPLHIYAFADDNLLPLIERQLAQWRHVMNDSFSFEMWPVEMPVSQSEKWRTLFRPCAAQRLFIPTLLPNVDSIAYLDSDTLLVGPIDELWQHFSLMNTSQLAAMANESNAAMNGWYTTPRGHPSYGQFGINSGVLLMNLTRMRATDWMSYIVPTYEEYHNALSFGDQDILNIIFAKHPEKLLVLPCSVNYRTEHCEHGCDGAHASGLTVVHGNRMAFHESGRKEGLEAIYTAYRDYELGADPYTALLLPMRQQLELRKNTPCGRVKELLIKSIESHLEEPTFMVTFKTE